MEEHSSDLKTVGERIEHLINEMDSLHEATGVEYFKAQALAWSGWVWMLQDRKRREWKITSPGDAQGMD